MKGMTTIRGLFLRRIGRWAERLVWIGGFLVGLVLLFYLASDWFLVPQLRRYFQEKTGAAVFLERVRWKGPFTLQIGRLTLAEDAQNPQDTLLASFEQADCVLSWSRLLRLELQPRLIQIKRAVAEVRYNADLKQWNFKHLKADGKAAQGRLLPEIVVQTASIRIQKVREGKRFNYAVIDFQGRLRRNESVYQVFLEASPAGMFAGSRLEGVWQPDGSQGRVELNGRIRMPLVYLFGNAWNLENLHLACRYEPNRFHLEQFSCGLGDGRISLQGQIQGPLDRGNLSAAVNLDNLYLSAESTPDAIVYSEPILEWMSGGLERFLRRYRPQGRADASLQIDGLLSEPAQSRIVGSLVCRDISILDRKFPYRFEQICGVIELKGRDLILRDLQAKNGPSHFTIRGQIQNFGPQSDIQIQVISEKVLLTEEIKQALPPALQQKWFELAPSGTCGFEYRYHRRPNADRSYRAVVHLHDISCLYDRFPYPLSHLTGTMVFEPNLLTLQGITARPGSGREIRMEGTIQNIRQGRPICDLTLTARGLPVDEAFRNAFPKQTRRFLSQFQVQGTVDLEVRIQGLYEEDKPLPYSASFAVEAEQLFWKPFPMEFEGVLIQGSARTGTVEWRSSAHLPGGGSGQLIGRFWARGHDPNQPGIQMAFTAEEVPLNSSFWTSLEQTGLYQELLSEVRASGFADAAGRFLLNCPEKEELSAEVRPSQERQLYLKVQLKEGHLYHPGGRWRTGPASGIFCLEDGRLAFSRWRIADVPIQAVFSGAQNPAGGNLLSWEPFGRVDVQLDQLQWDPSRFPSLTSLQGRLELHEAGLQKFSVSDVGGFIEGGLTWAQGARWPQGTGRFSFPSVGVFERSLSGIEGNWTADPNTGILTLQDIRGSCGSQGRFLGHVRLNVLEPLWPFEAEMVFENIPLDWVLASTAQAKNEGRIRGAVDLRGQAGALKSTEGRMTIEADQMKIGQESLLGKALAVMQLRPVGEYLFTQLYAESAIKGPIVHFERILMTGQKDVFQGQGRFNLTDGSIHIVLSAFGRRKDQPSTLWTGLAENLGAALSQVEISGTLTEPVITQIPLPLLPRPF
jgi:hypothetical protein